MRKIQLRDAEANLSALIDDAMDGRPSSIIRQGQSDAVILGFQEWLRLSQIPSFARLLMAVPAGLQLERDQSQLWPMELDRHGSEE